MDLIYLDYNCFQRGFDDFRQIRIQMESLACQEIFVKAERDEGRDDRLIKWLKRLKLEIVIMNPVDYIRQEMS
jgi:hypothetical protein